MKSIAALLVCVSVVASCRDGGRSAGTTAGSSAGDQVATTTGSDPAATSSSGGAPSTVPEAYRSDIDNLCDAVARSGAEQGAAAEYQLVIAKWLGDHIQTDEARQYLARIQPLTGDAKAAALDAEARRVGLARCALSDQWRSPPAAP